MRDPGPGVDGPGQVALIGGLFLLVFALLRGNARAGAAPGIVAMRGGGGALLGAVRCHPASVSSRPMLPLGLLRQPRFAGPQVAAAGISASFFALFLYLDPVPA